MYNTLTGGKIEILPFLMDLALLKQPGRAETLWKTRFVFDCVGAQQRQDIYCACSGISPPLLLRWINAKTQALPGVLRPKMQ